MGKGRGEGSYVGKLGFFLDYSAMLLGILCLVKHAAIRSEAKKTLDFRDLSNIQRQWLQLDSSHASRASLSWTVFTGIFTVASLGLMILQSVVTLPKKIVGVIYLMLFAAWIFIGLVLIYVMEDAGIPIAAIDIRFNNTFWMATLYLFSALWNFTSET